MKNKILLSSLLFVSANSTLFAQNEIVTKKSESLKEYKEANLKQKF